jgi:hypothetical protein
MRKKDLRTIKNVPLFPLIPLVPAALLVGALVTGITAVVRVRALERKIAGVGA